jgi:AraC-like protein
MLILDTTDVPRADRGEAFAAAMQQSGASCRVEYRRPQDEMAVRMQAWSYGPATLMSTDATGFRLTRTAAHVRRDGEPVVGLSFQARGCGEFAQFGHEQLVRGPDLMLVDMGAPYSFGCALGGGARVLLVSYDELDLPLDVVRAAVPGVAASPLRRLLRTHLARLVAASRRPTA